MSSKDVTGPTRGSGILENSVAGTFTSVDLGSFLLRKRIKHCQVKRYSWSRKFSFNYRNKMARAFKKFIPMFDRVLVERFAPEMKTKSGIMIPEKAQGKVQQATVLAVGSGSKTNKGETLPMNVQVGDKVLLPEYGGTKIVLEDQDYFLFQEKDIIGKFES